MSFTLSSNSSIRRRRRDVLRGVAALGLMPLAAATVEAQTIRYAIAAEVNAVDPQYANLSGYMMVAKQMFESLTDIDADGRLQPKLAARWRRVGDTVWEFDLQPGIRFQDGSPLTADDVVYSLARPAHIPPGPATLNGMLVEIAKSEAVDPLHLRLTTRRPIAVLPNYLSAVPIMSRKLTEHLAPEDFETGRGMVGTGPYRFVRFVRGDRIELARNEAYWGRKPYYANAVIRFIPNPPARTAALLSGEVDAITQVPPPDLARLRHTPGFEVITKPLGRFSFLVLNQVSDVLPMASDLAGHPLAGNPFKDVRVRRALSKAIDRPMIARYVLDGLGVPTQNPVPPTMFGYDRDLPPEPYDLPGAQRLMAEAGYPHCFRFSLFARGDNNPTEAAHALAIGQMLARLGCKVSVESLPTSVVMSRANKLALPIFLQSSGADAGDIGVQFGYIFGNPANNPWRKVNMQTYDSPRFRHALEAGLASSDDEQRARDYHEMLRAMHDEVGIIPLQLMVGTWAQRRGVSLTPRFDERLYASEFQH